VRIRAATQVPARLLLLVHGWTGDENSMWVFVRNFPPNRWIVAPRAPYATEPSGYSWRPLPAEDHDRPTLDNLRPAVDALTSFVDSYAADYSIDASQFDAMGFSQGAALVAALALLHPDRINRVSLLAGFVPPGAEALAGQHLLEGKTMFVAHGTLDERVDIAYARRSVQILRQAGADVTYCEDEVGHKLSVKCLHALETFFS
jgi:phospholipase/carboxylesterase